MRIKSKLQKLLHAPIRNRELTIPAMLARRLKLTLWGDAHSMDKQTNDQTAVTYVTACKTCLMSGDKYQVFLLQRKVRGYSLARQ